MDTRGSAFVARLRRMIYIGGAFTHGIADFHRGLTRLVG
jgi:hypothetical protein